MSWAPAGAERYRLYDSAPQINPAAAESSLNSVATPSKAAAAAVGALSLENPVVILGGLAALTLGLMAFSTSGTVRVGKQKLTGSLGVGSA